MNYTHWIHETEDLIGLTLMVFFFPRYLGLYLYTLILSEKHGINVVYATYIYTQETNKCRETNCLLVTHVYTSLY